MQFRDVPRGPPVHAVLPGQRESRTGRKRELEDVDPGGSSPRFMKVIVMGGVGTFVIHHDHVRVGDGFQIVTGNPGAFRVSPPVVTIGVQG